ncbi:hypothetical protein LTR53_015036 [Teratosphaeriaceae sp. CCFEE 6253]|nr:hypothetical protein LTR53_015036 [Teratosphaeriaceae sp. CCFEE 6253]
MCVAGLNVSTQACNHRWYELRRACHPANHLANCPEKLRVEGWETRNAHCPWCSDTDPALHTSTHRLFGRTASTSPTLSSPASPEIAALTRSRSGSAGTLTESLSRHSSAAGSVESERRQRHRDMNERLHIYLTRHPHEILPSAARNYPTFQSAAASPVEESPAWDGLSVMSAGSAVGKGWKKSVRFSMAMLRSNTS